ncbi:LPS export ABC transporter periplasmic protein LptC [Aestuariivirga sp.]|uniref:LPS export ABC transporter periplasmic protein LptC n=1 Tax=Aestuariivirga sp. TaxID=2650926 RepID=UPI0039E27284
MSSHTEADTSTGAIRQAVLRARIAPILTWISIAAVAGFAAVFVLQAGLFAYLVPATPPAPPTIDNPDKITSDNSVITGRDSKDQPYKVTATHAWQDPANTSIIHMKTMKAVLNQANANPSTVVSDTAVYNSDTKQADLAGNVVIVRGDGTTAKMDTAKVYLKEQKLTSNVPVVVTSNDMIVRANGMEITNDGDDILFLNGVKTHFGGPPAKGDSIQ